MKLFNYLNLDQRLLWTLDPPDQLLPYVISRT